MLKRLTLFTLSLVVTWLCLYMHAAAQQAPITVTGTVYNAQNDPLNGASVSIHGSNEGTTTDAAGKFSIRVPSKNSTLLITSVGYLDERIRVGSHLELSVVLRSASEQFDSVVIVGYGVQKKSSLTAAVASANVLEIQKQVAHDVGSALQGRLPGVRVENEAGIAGSDTKILIRGLGSFGETQPLIVIDGAFATNNLVGLNPNDIESIEVLKDAAAAAIYGSRAANGVVLVTTKTGKAGEIKVALNSSFSLQVPAKKLDFLNAREWADFANILADNSGTERAPKNDQDFDPNVDTDWQDVWFVKAPIYNNNVSISGGGKNFNAFTSFGHLKQEGIQYKSAFEKFSWRLNTNFTKGIFTVRERLGISRMSKVPVEPKLDIPTIPRSDANGLPVSGGPEYYVGASEEIVGIAEPFYVTNRERNTDITGGVGVDVQLIKGLKYTLGVSGSYNIMHDYRHEPKYATLLDEDGEPNYDYGNDQARISESRGEEFNYTIDNLLNFHQKFRMHDLDVLLGTTWYRENLRAIDVEFEGLTDNSLTVPAGVGNIDGTERKTALLSYFGRLNYSFADKYLLSLSLRRDESSLFARNRRVGYFPSYSAGWNIHNEPFFSSSLFSLIKVRASYGKLGANFIQPYSFESTAYGPVPVIMGEDQDRLLGNIIRLADPNLTWEKAESFNVGTELGILNDKLQLVVDYFIRRNYDLLAQLQQIPSGGQTIVINDGEKLAVNAATVQNKGFEFLLTYRDTEGDFKFNVSVNGTAAKNKVLELGKDVLPIRGDGFSGSFTDAPTLTQKGLPVGTFYLYKVVGLDDNGDFIFEDTNKDGVRNEADKQVLGSPFANFEYGINFSGTFKNFDFTAFLQGVQGNKIFSAIKLDNYFTYTNNVVKDVLRAWTPSNKSTNIPRMVLGSLNPIPSSFYLEDGSYLRLKNLQVGYTFRNIGIPSLRIYLGGQNLLTFTKYSGYDPEVGGGFDAPIFNRGVDRGAFPNARIYTIGLQAGF